MEQNCEYATSRIPKVLAWSRTNQILLAEEGFEGKNQTIGDSVIRSVGNCWSEATQTCLNPSNTYQVQNLMQIVRQAQLLGGDPEVFDPSKVRRCSGLWSGIVTHEWTYDEDADVYEAGAQVTRRQRLRRTQKWQVMPHVIEDGCVDCQSRMYETTWTGSASVDNLYRKEFPNCTETHTDQGQIEGDFPSALSIGLSSNHRKFHVTRAGGQSAPPESSLSGTTDAKHVWCNGYEETGHGSVSAWESWRYDMVPDEIPLDRTDPTIPTTSAGQVVDRQESRAADGGLTVITNTLTWKLTLEPDAGQ
jgi:hypothetical protein